MGTTLRWALWAVAGIGALAAGAHLGGGDGGSAGENMSSASSGSDRVSPVQEPKSLLADFVANPSRGKVSGDGGGDLFKGQGRAPAARPAVPAPDAVAARPVAPPFPYKYAGWYKEGRSGKTKVYLSKGSDLRDVDAGEVLDETWRIDSIDENRIEVTFLPGGQQLAVLVSAPVREGTPGGATAAGQAPSRSPFVASASPQASRAVIASDAEAQHAAPAAALAASGGFPFAMPAQGNPTAPPGGSAGAIAGPAALPSGKLGTEVPTSGSMPQGPAPIGKLGL